MADEDPGRDLPQRVRGAARPGPAARSPSPSPVLSEELRQRIRAAVTAERSGASAQPDEAPAGEATSPEPLRPARPWRAQRERPIRPESRAWPETPGKPETPGRSDTPAVSEPPVRPARAANAGPIAEDEITEWLATTAKPPSEVKPPSPVKSPSSVRPRAAGQFPVDSPHPPGRSRSRARQAARLVAVVLIIGVLAAAAVRYLGRSPADSRASAAAARHAAKVRAAAASWVVQQVSRDVRVSCDSAMCAALRAHGFPSDDLLVLGSASQIPVTSAVVVETPAVLSLFGTSLAAAWAPAVLASFGSGPSLVAVRVIAPNGAAAYQTRLRTDLADRKTAGAALLGDKQISVPSLASEQLTAGAVDSRLLEALVFIAGHQPISIVQFGNPGPGASADLPLRYVDLAERDPASHLSSAAYATSVRAYLSTADTRFRPARMMTVTLADGQAVLRIEVTAPSPLGVFGAPPAP